MAVRNTRLGGSNFIDGEVAYDYDFDDTFDRVVDCLVPVGGVIAWHKTFVTADSGTTTSTTANKLVQTGQNFLTTVSVGNIVFNTTDTTWAYVTAVDSNTTLSLSADIMATTEAYTIYKTPRLVDAWVECNGQVLSDVASVFNGATIPSLNGTTDATSLFIRGLKDAVTGTTGGSATQVHQWNESLNRTEIQDTGGGVFATTSVNSWQSDGTTTTTTTSGGQYTAVKTVLPPYVNLTWIMRVK